MIWKPLLFYTAVCGALAAASLVNDWHKKPAAPAPPNAVAINPGTPGECVHYDGHNKWSPCKPFPAVTNDSTTGIGWGKSGLALIAGGRELLRVPPGAKTYHCASPPASPEELDGLGQGMNPATLLFLYAAMCGRRD